MAHDEAKRLASLIGEIYIALKKMGVVPVAALTYRVDNGVITFVVTIEWQNGYTRQSYRVQGESTEYVEEAFYVALSGFWKTIMDGE